MQSTISQHDHGALSLYPDLAERVAQAADRAARLELLDPEQLTLALEFLIGYQPEAFDAALEAVEPGGEGAPAPEEEMEPFCRACLAPVGLFPAHGLEYWHYHRATVTDGPRSYRADHPLQLGWRYLADALRAGL
jgi:hypothetical protein